MDDDFLCVLEPEVLTVLRNSALAAGVFEGVEDLWFHLFKTWGAGWEDFADFDEVPTDL